jgi:hypothetical protein
MWPLPRAPPTMMSYDDAREYLPQFYDSHRGHVVLNR